MPDNKPIRIGIIGTGIFAHRHHRAFKAVGSDKFQIVACANRSRDKALAFAKEVGGIS
jgi:UDP-N-acetyl-2-amino-2-deoxyglucuronate dehydrogenase